MTSWAGFGLGWAVDGPGRAAATGPVFAPGRLLPEAVRLRRLELLWVGRQGLIRAESTDGVVGWSAPTDRISYLHPLLQQRILPYFLGRDLRELEALIDGVYLHQANYKLAGLAFWIGVAWVEFALLDLLGRTAGCPATDLLGGARRQEVEIYLSSMRRDTTPEQEVEWLGQRLAETGARAVKLKIGGRMSGNGDAAPGRTEHLVRLARRTWGEEVRLLVDANGSYDAPTALAVGRMLEREGVEVFEEPCPWEDFVSTKAVADGLDRLRVAGGEQDTSPEKFRWYLDQHGLDLVQPDVSYYGGILRGRRLARWAEAAGVPVTPHSPQAGHPFLALLQFAALPGNLWDFQEYNAAAGPWPAWLHPEPVPREGRLPIPRSPGLGAEFDPEFLARARAEP